MSGPWEAYQQLAPAAPAGPWAVYQSVDLLEQPTVNAPGGILNAIFAGLQASSTGLALRGKAPDIAMSPDANFFERTAGSIAGLAGDVPAMIVGGAAGAPGGPIGIAAGAFAVPQAIREGLMEAYERGGANSWSDVWNILTAGGKGATEGAVLGAATGGAGKFARGFLSEAAPLARGVGVVGAETTALVSVGAALEGEMPIAQDFIDAAVLVGGLHAIQPVSARLRKIYARTGQKPADVAVEAMKDPELKQELVTTEDVPARYRQLAEAENARASVLDPKELSPEALQAARDLAEKPFADVPQAPGEPKLKGYPNFNYINGEADLAGAVARLAELNRDRIQVETRGRVSNEQTIVESQRRLADMLGTTPDKISFSRALAPDQLAAENFLRAKLAVDAAAAWKQASKEIVDLGADASPAQLANYMVITERTGMVLSSHLGLSAEVGRAQQILKTVREQTKDLRQIQEFLDRYGKPEQIVELAKIGANAKDAAAALRGARDATKPTMLQKILEIWKGVNLLSGPPSHLANIFGSQTALWFTVPEQALAVAVGRIRGGKRMTSTELRARVAAIGPGYIEGLKAASEVIRGKRTEFTSKLDLPKTQPIFQAEKGGLLPFRLLTGEDMVARIPAERMEAFGRATRMALEENLRPGTREFNERVTSIANNPEVALGKEAAEAFIKAVKDAGHDVAFTTRLGEMGRGLQKTVRGTPLEFFVPFITTPANLVKWAARRIPIANLLMESVRADLSGKNGPIAKDLAIARTLMGGTVILTVIAAVENDIITGGGISDPEQRRTKMAAGWQPYSIKIGDTYYSYERIDPIARIVAAAADYAEIFGESQSDDKLNLGAVTAAAIGNALVSQTYLSGLANLVMAITDPQRYGGRLLDQYAASLVPSLIGQTAAALDPKTREINSIFDAIQARIPGLREELMAKRNPLTGEEIPAKGRLFPLAPISTTIESSDRVLTEAARLEVNLAAPPKKVHIGRATGKIGDVEITPEQRNYFTQVQGQFAHQILSQVVNSSSWDSIPDIAKAQLYKKVLSTARQQAALKALPPEARATEAVRIAQEIAAQFDTIDK